MSTKKILIAVPCMDQVAAPFAHSLASIAKPKDSECVIKMLCGSLIYDSRNKLAADAVKMGAYYILWIDADMVFNADALNILMQDLDQGADIASGLYFRRAQPYTPVAFDKIEIHEDGGPASFENYSGPLSGITEVGGVGFGFVLMKTDVILDCLGKYGTCFTPLAGFGEDLSFCWRARQQGYKVVLDANVKLGHVGHVVITEDFYKAFNGGPRNESKS